MKRTLIIWLALIVTVVSGEAFAEKPVWENAVAAHATHRWKDVAELSFTWKHHKKGIERSYVWDVAAGSIEATIDGKTFAIPYGRKGLTGADLDAHKKFINDSYWLLFEFHIRWDRVELRDLGMVDNPVPKFRGRPAMVPAFRVSYPPSGGHTPGDSYVAYLDKDGSVFAWSYFPAGATEPKLTATRGERRQFGPISLPTAFESADGELLITIENVSVR